MIRKEEHMRSQPCKVITWTLPVVLAAILACIRVMPLNAKTQPTQKGPAQAPAKPFDNPQQAAEALIQATESYDVPVLVESLAPDVKDIIASADPVRDKSIAAAFAAKAPEKNLVTIDAKNNNRAILSVGNE